MASHTTAAPAARTATTRSFTGVAFSTWAAAFAVGVLIHEWQFLQPPLRINTLIVTAALAVILRPSAVWRIMLLIALLTTELAIVLPNPQNHLMFIGIVGATTVPWWLWLRWRSPDVARDPAQMYARFAPYLRIGFVLMWYFAALAKMNSGFEVIDATCSVWILELIPGVHIPDLIVPLVIVGTVLLECSVPTLLLFHRTRPLAIMAGFGFHFVSALAGHSAFSGFGWSFYLLFLPPAAVARAVVVGRRTLPAAGRCLITWVVAHAPAVLVTFALAWMAAGTLVPIAAGHLEWQVRRWGACLLCLLWMSFTAWLLFRVRAHWLPASLSTPPPGPRASLRVRNGMFLLGLVAVLCTAAMPYLGLKTRAAFTMYANLRTEPGHWNHLIIPESARVFDWQDGDFVFLDSDDPRVTAQFAGEKAEHTVLLGARRIVDDYPDATVHYLLDGAEHTSRVSADPALGLPPSAVQRWFGAMRPFVEGGTCQH